MDNVPAEEEVPITARSVLMKVLVENEQSLEWAKNDLVWTERALNDAKLRVQEQTKKVNTLRALVEKS